jgi:hypothetical protein
LILQKGNQYAVECHSKVADNCVQHGEYCDEEEDALDWVEDECWINTGEGWFCLQCNDYFMANLRKARRKMAQAEKEDFCNELEVGIDVVR